MLYLEGQGDLVSRLIRGITSVTRPVLRVINLLTKSPDPPSTMLVHVNEGRLFIQAPNANSP